MAALCLQKEHETENNHYFKQARFSRISASQLKVLAIICKNTGNLKYWKKSSNILILLQATQFRRCCQPTQNSAK
jgi:hypothetical protein